MAHEASNEDEYEVRRTWKEAMVSRASFQVLFQLIHRRNLLSEYPISEPSSKPRLPYAEHITLQT
jgi:hypothetical protein